MFVPISKDYNGFTTLHKKKMNDGLKAREAWVVGSSKDLVLFYENGI